MPGSVLLAIFSTPSVLQLAESGLHKKVQHFLPGSFHMSGVNGIFSSSLNRWSKSGKGKSNKKAKKEIFDSNIFSKKGWPRQFDPKPLTTNRPYQTIRSGFNFLVSSSVQSLTLGKIKIEGALLNILQQAVQCIHPLPFDTSMAGLRQHLKPTTSTMSTPPPL